MSRTRALLPAAALALLAGCGENEAELSSLKGQVVALQADANKSKADLAAAQKSAADAKAALDGAEKATTEATQKADAAAKDLAKAQADLQATRGACNAVKQEKENLAAELAKAKQAVGAGAGAGAAEIDALKAKAQSLEQQLAAKGQEAAQCKAAADAASAKAAALETQIKQTQSTPGKDVVRSRFTYSGTETLQPYTLIPLSFAAKKGETITWSWSVLEGPDDVAADLLDFAVVGPDQSKAAGGRAGWQKKDDKGSFTTTADGRWTVVWSNRHATKPYKVKFDASLTPMN